MKKSRASLLLFNDGIGEDDNTPLVELRFLSLKSRTEIFTINNGDSVLEYNAEENKLWVLRVSKNPYTKDYQDEVVLVKWDRQKRVADEDTDILERYLCDANESEIITFRRGGFKLVETYFSSTYNKLVLLSGNQIACVFSLVQRAGV